MSDPAQAIGALEALLRSRLALEHHGLVPALLALIVELSSTGAPGDELQRRVAADPTLAPLLPTLAGLASPAPGSSMLSLAGAQTGDVSVGQVAGNNIIQNTFVFGPGAASASANAAERFANGLTALRDLIGHSPAVRDSVVVFTDRLQAARLQVRELINLKTLHDLLHGLQYRDLPTLVRELPRFPDDDASRLSIEQCELQIRDVVQRVDDLINDGFVGAADVPWRSPLLQAVDQIRLGLDTDDRVPIERAARLSRSVIGTRLSALNNSLYQQARSLRLDDLAMPLRTLYERIAAIEDARTAIARVADGIAGLSEIHANLSALVIVHNAWQELDDELRRVESSLRSDTFELELTWPDLRARVVALSAGEERWAAEIRTQVDRLDQALTGGRPAELRVAFDRLQNRVGSRFFQIDFSLKQLCDRLRDFRDPLSELELMV